MTYLSFKALYARRLVRGAIANDLNSLAKRYTLEELEDILPCMHLTRTSYGPYSLPERTRDLTANLGNSTLPSLLVCIIGCGIAGLYTAMLLDSLEIPSLSYDILEASDRIGGRVRTHYFSDAM